MNADLQKSSTTLRTTGKTGVGIWGDETALWSDPLYTWGDQPTPIGTSPKSAVVISTSPKTS